MNYLLSVMKVNSLVQPILMTQRYYVAAYGQEKHIYSRASEAQAFIRQHPGAIIRSFPSYEAAVQAEAASSSPSNSKRSMPPSVSSTAPTQSLPVIDRTVIHVDQRYDPVSHLGLYAITIHDVNHQQFSAQGRLEQASSEIYVRLHAIYVALSLVQGKIILYQNSSEIAEMLTQKIHHWAKNQWVAVANQEILRSIYLHLQDKDVYFSSEQPAGAELNQYLDAAANQPFSLQLFKGTSILATYP